VTRVTCAFIVETTAPSLTLHPVLKPRSNHPTPSFAGTTSDTTAVTVSIYKGNVVGSTPVVSTSAVPAGGVWTSAPTAKQLADGEYTAQATQPSSIAGNPTGVSGPIKFIIDTKPPAVTLN